MTSVASVVLPGPAIRRMEVWYLNLDQGRATFAEGEEPSAIATSGQMGRLAFAAGLEVEPGTV